MSNTKYEAAKIPPEPVLSYLREARNARDLAHLPRDGELDLLLDAYDTLREYTVKVESKLKQALKESAINEENFKVTNQAYCAMDKQNIALRAEHKTNIQRLVEQSEFWGGDALVSLTNKAVELQVELNAANNLCNAKSNLLMNITDTLRSRGIDTSQHIDEGVIKLGNQRDTAMDVVDMVLGSSEKWFRDLHWITIVEAARAAKAKVTI